MTTITSSTSHETSVFTQIAASLSAFKTRFNTSRGFRTMLAVLFGMVIVIALYTPAILSGQF